MKKKLSKAKRGKNIAKDRSSMEEAPCVNAYSLFVAIDPLHIQHQNKFSLLELDAINKLESRLAAFNQSSGFSDVFESVRARMGIVQELSDTALKVLNGDHHAKQKLKLLAESGLVKQSDWNPSWDRAISLSGAKGSPRLVNAEALIKIAVAAELGCDDRSDPDATQTGLKRLLEPFAVLDAIARVLDETWGEKRASTLDLLSRSLNSAYSSSGIPHMLFLKELLDHLRLFLPTMEMAAHGLEEFGSVSRTASAQPVGFDVLVQEFIRIELGTVAR